MYLLLSYKDFGQAGGCRDCEIFEFDENLEKLDKKAYSLCENYDYKNKNSCEISTKIYYGDLCTNTMCSYTKHEETIIFAVVEVKNEFKDKI